MADAAALLEFRPVETRVPETVRPWRLAARLAFRFFAVYFGIYVVVTQMFRGLIPFSINIPNISAVGPVRWMVEWTAVNVFGVTTPLVFTGSGSGDKTTDWVLAFCLVIITAAITAVWSIAARGPVNYDSAHKRYRLFLRFSLGSTMLGYGVSKLIPLQTPFPSLTRLLEVRATFRRWACCGRRSACHAPIRFSPAPSRCRVASCCSFRRRRGLARCPRRRAWPRSSPSK